MGALTLYTIGVAGRSAQQFFETLRRPGLRHVLDVRLHNVSQLAGFSKREDLRYLLRVIDGIEYQHCLQLAPTDPMLQARRRGGAWEPYQQRFLALLAERCVEQSLERTSLAGACLLCSERTPEHCHRRLAAEYLRERWGGLDIIHL